MKNSVKFFDFSKKKMKKKIDKKLVKEGYLVSVFQVLLFQFQLFLKLLVRFQYLFSLCGSQPICGVTKSWQSISNLVRAGSNTARSLEVQAKYLFEIANF